MRQFRAPRRSLGDVDAEIAAKIITASADVALIVDKSGIIRDLASDNAELIGDGCGDWLGQPWIDTVTVESRPKVEELLRDASDNEPTRWRQLNHPTRRGSDLPVRYSAIRLKQSGRIIAIGHDLRAMAAMQQRLIEAQTQMEREYARLRQVETRYRALFQLSSEAILIADGADQKIVEANPAALTLLAQGGRRLIGRQLWEIVDEVAQEALRGLLTAVRTQPRADDVTIRLGPRGREVAVSATLFRHEGASHFLVRFAPTDGEGLGVASSGSGNLAGIVESMPEGFVVIDEDRRILTANSAFLEMCQLATAEQVKGRPIDRWLGRVAVDVDVLVANIREHGSVKRFSTKLRGEYGGTEDVEVSAVHLRGGDPPCFGISIRAIDRIDPEHPAQSRALTRSVEQLTGLVGRVPLKDLVRETTDIVEKLCIEAALQLTGDNRASAAEILGLSRQSLYVKLRRYGLGELDGEGGH